MRGKIKSRPLPPRKSGGLNRETGQAFELKEDRRIETAEGWRTCVTEDREREREPTTKEASQNIVGKKRGHEREEEERQQ